MEAPKSRVPLASGRIKELDIIIPELPDKVVLPGISILVEYRVLKPLLFEPKSRTPEVEGIISELNTMTFVPPSEMDSVFPINIRPDK